MLPVRAAAGVVAVLLALASDASALTGQWGPPACPPNDPAQGFFAICFDDLASGTATSAAAFPHVEIDDALVLSETHAAFLLGFDTSSWATTGDQGILNSLLPAVDFWFDVPIDRFRVDVVALPGPTGEPVPVVLQAFLGGNLVRTVISDVGLVLPDGTHHDRLQFGVRADHVRLFAALGPCAGADCEVGRTTGFFADSVKFLVPEPGAGVLLSTIALGLAALRGRRPAVRS
jgi:hypothetical protein